MLGWLVSKRLSAAERQLGVSVDYLRHLYRVSPGGFFKFARILPLAAYRKRLPVEPFHIATLVAVKHEDCGTCVQIGVNLALQDGVPVALIKAAVDARPDDLPSELADVYRFAESVASADGQEGEFRDRIRQRWGETALAEMALAIASCRTFPALKRGLGYATSCSRVRVDLQGTAQASH